ncbi:unnamed protein product [Candidula unifasciata]|uniref:FZ domain-containing protein n=1 Tax=Candidula unifasciata TaxID=100452 RepID=A0A8S4A815_9EUPU|nr:unnamed protein product [Candidula unifasciata]
MKLRMNTLNLFQVLVTGLTVYASPLSTPISSFATSPEASTSLTTELTNSQCQPVEEAACSRMYTSTQMPNLYGDALSRNAGAKIHEILTQADKDSVLVGFFCTLYLPPCADRTSQDNEQVDQQMVPLPCRPLCELAAQKRKEYTILDELPWPVRCSSLPTENCFNLPGSSNVTFVKTSINIKTLPNEVARFASLDVELGNDANYDVEVLSPSAGSIPERRYDITDLGDPTLFQGWADVQGTGAANDYCRVIGRGKRRFMSCNLSGSTGQGHHYVSKLGFEVGYSNTWFMRDMDGDGRDDYCRCVGTPNNSKMICMKAGEHGFYGSTIQGGNQHTFALPGSEDCSGRRYNPLFGESYS